MHHPPPRRPRGPRLQKLGGAGPVAPLPPQQERKKIPPTRPQPPNEARPEQALRKQKREERSTLASALEHWMARPTRKRKPHRRPSGQSESRQHARQRVGRDSTRDKELARRARALQKMLSRCSKSLAIEGQVLLIRGRRERRVAAPNVVDDIDKAIDRLAEPERRKTH